VTLLLAIPVVVRAESPAPAGSTATADWPMFRGGPSRSGEGEDGPHGQPVLRWRYQAPGPVNRAIAVVGDLVFESSDDGTLHTLDIASGVERWSYLPQHPPAGDPVVEGGVVYLFDGLGTLIALDAATGAERWKSQSTVVGASSPTFGLGLLYTASGQGDVVALDLADGTLRWSYHVPGATVLHAPAFLDGRVYVSSEGGGYSAIDATNGSLAWVADTHGFVTATAVAVNGIAYIGSNADATSGSLSAYDSLTGTPLWTDAEQLFSPAVSNGIAVSSGTVGVVVAHEARSGIERWRTTVPGETRSSSIADGVAYIGADSEHEVVALDLQTGRQLWVFDVDGGIECCTAVAHGLVFVGTRLGGVYAIGGSDDESAASPSQPTS
jgi:outer membrane protein assembly factor BamB